MIDQTDGVRRRIRECPVTKPAAPWTLVATIAVGGLTEVGFAEESDVLLVVSHSGRGLFDCRTGSRIARDTTERDVIWHDDPRLLAQGIGPLEGKWIRICGLAGGGLPQLADNGYWTEAFALDWPETHLLLGGPWGSLYDDKTRFTKLAIETDVRAFGFSNSGDTLVLATSSYLLLFRMEEELKPTVS